MWHGGGTICIDDTKYNAPVARGWVVLLGAVLSSAYTIPEVTIGVLTCKASVVFCDHCEESTAILLSRIDCCIKGCLLIIMWQKPKSPLGCFGMSDEEHFPLIPSLPKGNLVNT
ncbi:MAG: hypothetical protein DRG30_10750 [Epsilonproteobacteria bacterium]|nr:MAG: hypothetical protein DRG30_10750 [Campylobacterota bacterium]